MRDKNMNSLFVSNKIIILRNKIINRKDPYIFYEINESLYQLLLSIYSNKDFQIEDDLLDYLLDKEILTRHANNYNPFCKASEYNRNRLFIQLTNKCNLFCKHCYADSHSDVSGEYFTLHTAKQLIDNAVSLGIYKIDFTGGEVFIKKWFYELLKYMDSLPITYSIFTNLTLIGEAMIQQIKHLDGLCSVITSLDYFEKQKHNAFRGAAYAYDNTMQTIKALDAIGVKVYVNCVVMNDNHDDVKKIIQYFEDKNIEVHLDMIMECGRAERNIVQTDFIDDNIEFIKSTISKSKKIESEYHDYSNMETCGVADTLLFVDYKGAFNVCPSLTRDLLEEYYLGDSIEVAHGNLTGLTLKCNEVECKIYSKCSYGCRARALLYTGDVNGKDILMCKYLCQG